MDLKEFVEEVKKRNCIEEDTENIIDIIVTEVERSYRDGDQECVAVSDADVESMVIRYKQLNEMHEKEDGTRKEKESIPKSMPIQKTVKVEKITPKTEKNWEQESLF